MHGTPSADSVAARGRLVQRAARRRNQKKLSTPVPPIHHPKVILNIAEPLSVTTLPPGPSTDIQVLPSVCLAGLISTKAPIAKKTTSPMRMCSATTQTGISGGGGPGRTCFQESTRINCVASAMVA